MRETRHLWIGNLAENIREDEIVKHFKRYGKIDKVRFLPKRGGTGLCACVAFMDIRSAQKAKAAVNSIGDRELVTDYFDPSRGASGTVEEGQRHVQQSQQQGHRSSASRRYEAHRSSAPGGEERFNPDRSSSYDRNYQHSEVVATEGYDSDRGRPRADAVGSEKVKSRSRSSNSVKQHGSLGKKHKSSDPAKKSLKKKMKKKNEDGKVKAKKVKGKSGKERGRSPTTKHKKSRPTGATESAAGSVSRKVAKTGSSSEGRSSSSGSVSGSSSGSRRSSSATSTTSSGSANSSKTHTSISRSSGSSFEVEEGPEGRRLVAMCIRKLPIRPTVTSLRDGIYHEFKKYGKVKSVLVRGDGADRHALVLFRTAAEANKAVTHAKSKLLFGAAIEATIYDGEVSGQELEECGGIIDEFHPRASRTLFVGNLDKTVGYSDIQNIFVRFGEIVAIQIKKQHNIPQYAFLQYTDIASIVRAITKMDGEKLGRNTLKLGFGKTVTSSCLWVDGITESFTENYLASCFQRYGPVKHVVIDRNRGQALIFYAKYDFAQIAMAKMRGRKLNGGRLKLDFASNDLIEIFLKHMQNSGQSVQGLENIRQLLQPPSSPTPHQSAPSSSYNRSQDSRNYYDERLQPGYNEGQYTGSDGNFRRVWRGRSRERYPDPPPHDRQKRGYDDVYERTEYHRDASWERDGYVEGSRRTSHYDQDYRQREYDARREQRGYSRKPPRGSAAHEDSYHYRSARERPRDERDLDRSRERDRLGEPYYPPRSGHLSPSHPRYLSRRSRSQSPLPRDSERYSMERIVGDPAYRRHVRSSSRSPGAHLDPIRRRNSMESKSSSHSGSRYTSRTGDVDMREYLEESTLPVPSPRGDERIVEFNENAKKLRIRKRVNADSPLGESDSSPRPQRHMGCRIENDKPIVPQCKVSATPGDKRWQSASPTFSDNRSCSGTPTRDENDDLIGEVIIKHPPKPASTSEKSRPRDREGKSQYDEPRKERSKHDKDYRKGFSGSTDASESSGKTKPIRSSSASLIQRVHSPSDLERKSSLTYTKDFDYRKHAVTGSSKSSGDSASRHRSTKSVVYRHGDDHKHGRGHYDGRTPSSPHSASPLSERQRGPSGTSSLLKREYSPRPEEDEKPLPAKVHKSSEQAVADSDRQRHAKESSRPARWGKDEDSGDVEKRRAHSQKRRHSSEGRDNEGDVGGKRERRSSSGHHHQKHEAPMSIASQMFLQEEEESGTESPAIPQVLEESQNPVEEASASKWEVEDEDVCASEEESPANDFSISTVAAAQSLLPKRLPKPPSPKPAEQEGEVLQVEKDAKDVGNLTELEKEKVRIQKMLSKLDSEKQLDVKDAEEVAGVVLQELTKKARSKVLATMPAAKEETPAKETVTAVERSPKPSNTSEVVVETEDMVDQDGYPSGADVTFEEEIVVDTIEEVTEEEVIETEVVEVESVKEGKVDEEKSEICVIEDPPTSLSEIPVVVVPPPPVVVQDIDHSQGYRKQMEARKKEMEKQEKRKHHENKKLLRRQEKEKKSQIKKVSAMRGPSQSVISFVDEEEKEDVPDEDKSRPVEEVLTLLEGKPLGAVENVETVEQMDTPLTEEEIVQGEAKNDPESSKRGEEADVILETVDVETQPIDEVHDTEVKNSNLDLEQPWPPDRGKLPPEDFTIPVLDEAKSTAVGPEHSPMVKTVEMGTSKTSSVITTSPLTPSSTEHSTPSVNTLHAPTKDPSPKSIGQGVTPIGSLSSSLSQKSSVATPTSVTPSQSTRTPSFTTPSPASTSSTSSSKSQQKQRMKNCSSVHLKHKHHSQSSAHQQKRPTHPSRPDNYARPRSSHSSSSDHRRRSSASQQPHRSSSSSGHGTKPRPEGQKKPILPQSKRVMATITVGLDASPSKPLGKSELERLKAELECVRNQLDLDMSPSSLSPCSDNETTVGKSPAQLLSPVSPVLRSPADSAHGKKIENASPASQHTGSTSLTDRLKQIGRIKKKTPAAGVAVKVEPTAASTIQRAEETNFRKSRTLRSSIFDQDAERLSHTCRQLESNNNKIVGDQKPLPFPPVAPLFAGSKFLESSSFLNSNKPAIASPSATPLVAMPAPPVACHGPVVDPAALDQNQLSSITGPKNVLSLSSTDLPETAGRQHDFAGKNCNINSSDTSNHNTKNMESASVLGVSKLWHATETSASSAKRVTSTRASDLLPDSISGASGSIPYKDNTNVPHPDHPDISLLPSDGDNIALSKDASNPAAALQNPNESLKTDKGSQQDVKNLLPTRPQELGNPVDGVAVKPILEVDAPRTSGDVKIVPSDDIGSSKPPDDSPPKDYMEEVVSDMDVYAGSCMEIEEAPSDEVEVTETDEDVTTGLEMNPGVSRITPPSVENAIVEGKTKSKAENLSTDLLSDYACQTLMEEKLEETQIHKSRQDPEIDKPKAISDEIEPVIETVSKTAHSGLPTALEPEKKDCEPAVESLTNSEVKMKVADKGAKKMTEKQESKDLKKHKVVGKHRPVQKDTKSGSKQSSVKKTMHDGTKFKSTDSKSMSGKSVKSVPERRDSGKAKSIIEKTTAVKNPGALGKDDNDIEKQAPTSGHVGASEVPLFEKKDSKPAKVTQPEVKKLGQKSAEKEDSSLGGKAKDKELTKGKKVPKEGKKDKKSVEKKPGFVESKSDVKKLKKKEKRNGSPLGSISKAEKVTEHSEKDTALDVKNESDKSTLKEEHKTKGGSVDQETSKALPPSSKSEGKESGSGLVKKRKKKKHGSEKGKLDKNLDVKDSRNNPTTQIADVKRPEKEKKDSSDLGEKMKKSSKIDKPKSSDARPSSPMSKDSSQSGQGKAKNDCKKGELSVKSGKKDIFKKIAKGHTDLKASQSVPGKIATKKEGESLLTKKDARKKLLHRKMEKASSASPASKKSRYSLIYTDSESSSDTDDNTLHPPSKKKKKTPHASSPKSNAEKINRAISSPSNWSDLEDGVQAASVQRYLSSSSSSSFDSVVPPPVVESSLLVTETIKSETILPPGYEAGGFSDSSEERCRLDVKSNRLDSNKMQDEAKEGWKMKANSKEEDVEGFTDSSEDPGLKGGRKKASKERDETKHGKKKKKLISKQRDLGGFTDSSEDLDEFGVKDDARKSSKMSDKTNEPGGKKKRKKLVPKPREPTKWSKDDNKKKKEERKMGERPRIFSSSGEDSSEGDLVISMSSTDTSESNEDSDSSIKHKPSWKTKSKSGRKKPQPRTSEEMYGFEPTFSDSEDISNPLQIDESETPAEKIDKKNQKVPSKKVESVQPLRTKFDSSDDASSPAVMEKKKKKAKTSKDVAKEKKASEQSDAKLKIAEEKPKNYEKTLKKAQAREKSRFLPDLSPDSDEDLPEKIPAEVLKPKDSQTSLKKNLPPKSKESPRPGSGKAGLEKSKSDSKVLRASAQKLHEKKDKFKSKSRSLESATSHSSQVKKLKDSSSKITETKPTAETAQHSQPEKKSSSKDRAKGDKDHGTEDRGKEAKAVSTKKDLPQKSAHLKDINASALETTEKEQKQHQKESSDVARQKLHKKHSKDPKKVSKKHPVSTVLSKTQPEKTKSLHGKSQDSSKQDAPKHDKKKKPKKLHKKDKIDKPQVQQKPLEKIIKKEPALASPCLPSLEVTDKKETEAPRSMFNSDSDDDDFELVEEVSVGSPPVKTQKNLLQSELTRSPKTVLEHEKPSTEEILSTKNADDVPVDSTLKSKTSSTSWQRYSRNPVDLKIEEKRRASAESSLSTTDESDAEQKTEVESVMTSIVEDKKQIATGQSSVKFDPLTKACEEDGVFKSTEGRTKTKVEDSIRSEEAEAPEMHEKTKIKTESGSSLPSKFSHSGYQRTKSRLRYGVKDRRERMDKMKSISHERDEEAVRSIMGVLDESSDADSYFSDVRPEDGASSSTLGRNSDTERPKRMSRDSDSASVVGFSRHVETKVEEAVNPEPNDPTEIQVKVEEQSETAEARSTAEENELAAAVSSIEGIFGDFSNKPPMYEAEFPAASSTPSFSNRRRSEDKSQQKEPTPLLEKDAILQEEEEKGLEETALAASTLLAESSDSTFFGFQSTDSSETNQNKEHGESHAFSDIKLPSIKTDSTRYLNQTHTTTSPNTSTPSSQSSGSRKRSRHARGRGTSPRSSVMDSKSEVSASEASLSESESPLIEPGKMTLGHVSAKQRRTGNTSSSSEQPSRNSQTDASGSSSSSLSFVKSDPIGGTPPFVCTSTVSAAQTLTSPAASANTPFVNVSNTSVPAVTSEKPSPLAPTHQQRKTSRDSDAGGTTKRRPSSSAISPTCGSQPPQLTIPTAPNVLSSFGGGMQTPGSSIYPAGNSPFLSRPAPHTPQSFNKLEYSTDMHPVSQTMLRVSTSISPPSSNLSTSHHPQGYPPHLLSQPTTYSVKPNAPTDHHPYTSHPQSFFPGASITQSMPCHTNFKPPMHNAGMQPHPSKSNSSMAVAAMPFQTPNSSASITSSASYQSQFPHHIIQPAPAATHKSQDSSQPPTQYHVGVPTYPHKHVASQHQQPMVKPDQQQVPQHAQTPAATQPEPTQNAPLRPPYPHPRMAPPGHPVYPPRMFSHQGQVLPQSPYGLPSTNLPQSSPFSPTTTMMPSVAPQSQEQFRQRGPSNLYMSQNVPQIQPTRPTAPPQLKATELQQPSQQAQTAVGKAEPQRPPLSSVPSTGIPGAPQASSQPMYRKMDPVQPHLLGAQPGVPPQQVFAHPMYYPAGVHGIPGLPPGLPGYMSQVYGMRPGMSAAPVTMVHPSAQMPEMPRHVQQRHQMPQRNPLEKPQPYGTMHQPGARIEQQAPSPTTTKASPTVRDAPHMIHPSFGMPQVASQPMGQVYGTVAPSSSAPAHPHRYHHGDRVVRVPSEQEQLKMVDQHFKRSGIATVPPRSHPPSVSSTGEKPRYTPPTKQEPLVNPSMLPHPSMFPQATLGRPPVGMVYSHGFSMPPVVRFAPEQHVWPRPGLPPPTVTSQMSPYTVVPSSPHPAPHSSTLQPQSRMALSQPQASLPPKNPKHDDQVLDLFERYPVIWQGLLAIKNDSAAVQTHFICGNRGLAQAYLPQPDAQGETDKERDLAVLRIVQRMRLEPPQLEVLDGKMTEGTDFCVLLALPCGRDESDVIRQQSALKQGFIEYLKQKHAAGIVNVQHQHVQSPQQYVLHVFPPCEFTTKHLERHAQDLLSNINDIQHIMIVIATM